MVLKGLNPEKVFCYFEELSAIPRGSGNEKGISDYLCNFAKSRNLEVIQDSVLNIIIKKPGTAGYEASPTVILQGHMDMVCEKNNGTDHDFMKDGLKLVVDGDFVKAEGTTLGADNGIAMAYALAILDATDIAHPPIEVLLTTAEETGMDGAMGLNPENISGRLLINIDSEEEGKLLVSCSGGLRDNVKLPITWEVPTCEVAKCAVRVRGLKGGHSGMDANKGRGNANKILARFLVDLTNEVKFNIVTISGGSKSNAIPREADITLAVAKDKLELVKARIAVWNNTLKNELRSSDPDVELKFEELSCKPEKMFSDETTEKAVKLLYLIPSGIKSMSMDIKDLVESSTNLGVVTTEECCVNYESAVRSSVKSLKNAIVSETRVITELLGAEFTTTADYPEWQYNPDSKLRDLFQKVHKDVYGNEAEIVAIHAGVECGLFKEMFGEIDMISFGPNLFDVHSPDEKMSISSVERSWNYLLAVLKEMK